jgi:hypothetical protein
MQRTIEAHTVRYGSRMRSHVETSLRAGFTRKEIENILEASGLERVRLSQDESYFIIDRTGESDPNSWIKAREQYL